MLARLGTSLPVEPMTDPAPLVEASISPPSAARRRGSTRTSCAALNARILHQLPFAAVAERLPDGMGEAAWQAIRPNLGERRRGGRLVADRLTALSSARAPTRRTATSCARPPKPPRRWTGTTAPWRALTAALKEATGRKGKALFLPLRRALTGRDSGPEMAALLPLIGKRRTIERLRAAAG